MADEALGLFNAMRPSAPAPSADIRTASGNLHSLAMIPGTPGYNSRIPKPPCYRCGEDHMPGHDYGHPWEDQPVHDEPVSATAIMTRPAPSVHGPEVQRFPNHESATRRVALYVGRGDTYVVAVEEPPDWDSVDTFKVRAALVLPLVRLARALGTKVMDKTGGDLFMLEQEQEESDARGQPAPNHERGAEGAGDRRPRRQERGPAGQEEDWPSPGEGEAG